jgi:hypothetical protein
MKPIRRISQFFNILFILGVIFTLSSCQTTSNIPPARYGASMIFDPVGSRILLFGGRADGLFGLKYYNDMWSFDTASQKWSPVKTKKRPPERLSPGMVYDPGNHQIIIFGGHGAKVRLGDTWVYSISENRWEEITPETSPSPRSDMGMSFDTENNRVILFSGYSLEDGGVRANDTWSYDPNAQKWAEMKPQSAPPIMYGQSFAYDAEGSQSVLVGGHISLYRNGQYSSGGYNSGVWSYNYMENRWQEVESLDSDELIPPARYWQGAAMNSTDQELLIFGGNSGMGFIGDTWIYDVISKEWGNIDCIQIPEPPPRVNGAVVYDPKEEAFVLFGGLGDDMTDFQDTWIFRESSAGGDWIAAAAKD